MKTSDKIYNTPLSYSRLASDSPISGGFLRAFTRNVCATQAAITASGPNLPARRSPDGHSTVVVSQDGGTRFVKSAGGAVTCRDPA